MREGIGARGGVGGGAACNAEANAEVEGNEEEEETEYAEEDDGAASNGMGSRFLEEVLDRGKVRDDLGVALVA